MEMHDVGLNHKPSIIRLVLNGRVFDVAEEACEEIPLLKKRLPLRQSSQIAERELHQEEKSTQKFDRGASLIRRNSLEQCQSILNSPHAARADLPHVSKTQTSKSMETLLTDLGKPTPSDAELNVRHKKNSNDPEIVLYFQRNASVFESLLDFVQNGELHVPCHVCPKLFARDLNFWGFDISDIDPCCYPRIVSFLEQQKTVMKFHKNSINSIEAEETVDAVSGGALRTWRRLRISLWKLLTDPWSSLMAKIYFIILCLVILASYFVIAANTTKEFTRSLTRGEWREYLGDEEFEDYKQFINDFYDDADYDVDYTSTTSNTTQSQPSKQYSPRALMNWVQNLSFFCIAFLTVDFIIRLVVCPSFRQFILNFINLCDLISLCAAYAKYTIDEILPMEQYERSGTDLIHALQLFRILRFLGPMSKVTGFRVIYFTLKNSMVELLLVFALLGFLVMFFAVILFYFGDKQSMQSIPMAMWYALITITTVGYGDVVPLCFRTKLIGSVCAVLGVIFISMTLPIVVNNFFTLYASCSIVPPKRTKRQRNHTEEGLSA